MPYQKHEHNVFRLQFRRKAAKALTSSAVAFGPLAEDGEISEANPYWHLATAEAAPSIAQTVS